MRYLLTLTLSGSVLALLLLALRYFILRRMPSTVYYYAWLLVLLRFALPVPGFIPVPGEAKTPQPAAYSDNYTAGSNDQISESQGADRDQRDRGVSLDLCVLSGPKQKNGRDHGNG